MLVSQRALHTHERGFHSKHARTVREALARSSHGPGIIDCALTRLTQAPRDGHDQTFRVVVARGVQGDVSIALSSHMNRIETAGLQSSGQSAGRASSNRNYLLTDGAGLFVT